MHIKLYLIRHGETEDAQANRYKGHIDMPLSENGIKQMEQLSKYLYHQSTEHPVKLRNGAGRAPRKALQRGRQNTELKAVYTSDLRRAMKSAEIIAEPHNIKPTVVKALRERNFGIWEGMSFGEIKGEYPKEFKAWASNPLRFSPMEGESTIEVKDRAINALNEILNDHFNQITEHKIQNTEHPVKLRNGAGRAQSTDRNNLGSEFWDLSSEDIAIVAHGGVNRVILCHLLGIPLENIFRIEQDFGALNIIEFYNRYPVVKLINYTV